MTKNLIFTLITAVLLNGMFLSSCDKNENDTLDKKGEIKFSFAVKENLKTQKTKSTNSKTDAVAVVVTIKTTAGVVVFDKKKLDLINFNGSFISQSLPLIVGDYQLTEFFVLDANNKTIYSTPLEGAPLAYLITDPLPINFAVTKDQVTKVAPEVISTNCDCQANDFGYTSFDFVIVSPICFYINVQVYNTTTSKWEVTTANVSIKGDGTALYAGTIAAITDSLKIKDGYTYYIISISKAGYITKDSTLTNAQLKTYFNKPILFTLKVNRLGEVIFNPNLTYGSMTDQDDNMYKTITIGTQIWMAENLRTAHYRNGNPIPEYIDKTTWQYLTSGAFGNYKNTHNNDSIKVYGRIYNWYAVADSRNIAPVGWHVPTDAELTTLINYLGGLSVADSKMKETGFTHWTGPNTYATNQSGFTAIPGGVCEQDGTYHSLGDYGGYWSSSLFNTTNAWTYAQYSNTALTIRYYCSRNVGFSIRLVKD